MRHLYSLDKLDFPVLIRHRLPGCCPLMCNIVESLNLKEILIRICEEFQKQATKEDTEKDDEEKREKTQERISDYDVDCPVCTAVLEDEKGLQDD